MAGAERSIGHLPAINGHRVFAIAGSIPVVQDETGEVFQRIRR